MRFKKSSKIVLGLSIAVLLMGTPAMAVEAPAIDDEITLISEEEAIRSEEYVWFYRTYEGRRQKRLWSITYGHWVTDWIDIGPA